MSDTYIGKWNRWYAGLEAPASYGDTKTYHVGAEFLGGIDVEDWGSGKGFFKTVYEGEVLNVDGTKTPYTDVVADLREYTTDTPGLFMRHVLEHNYDWEKTLENAVASFSEKFALVLFTPMKRKTEQIAWNEGPDVPDMAFSQRDIVKHFDGLDFTHKDYKTATQYGKERVYLVSR